MSDQRAGGIGWTDETWNPVRGCSRVSPGCENCYAERVAARFSGPGQPYEGLATMHIKPGHRHGKLMTEPRWTGAVRLIPEHLADPLRWRRPRRVFVNSMSDLFHEKLTNEEIAAVFGVMAAAPRHTFQILTKRPERMLAWFRWLDNVAEGNGRSRISNCAVAAEGLGHPVPVTEEMRQGMIADRWPLPNVWLGVSVEDQRRAYERIPWLLETPAAVRFVSAEPLIGPVMLQGYDGPHIRRSYLQRDNVPSRIDWVIAGCESGPGARPMDLDWARSIRDQCAEAGVPFFLKQSMRDGKLVKEPELDGRQHLEFPKENERG